MFKIKTAEDIDKKMVRYHNDVKYSITINPDDSMQSSRGQSRPSAVRNNVLALVATWTHYIEDIDLRMDISFPQQLGTGKYPRIHYHGSLKFKDITGFLVSLDGNVRFQIEIDTIEDSKIWKRYCRKFEKLHDGYKMYAIRTEQVNAYVLDKNEEYTHEKANIVELCKAGQSR